MEPGELKKKAAKRFKPWPKKKDTLRNCLIMDKDRLKEIYLNGGRYAWRGFCEENGYDPHPRHKEEFPLRLWQAEWLAIKISESHENVMDQAIDAKKFIMAKRLESPKAWFDTSSALKNLGDFILMQETEKARWDQQNKADIDASKEKAKFKMSVYDFRALATGQKAVMDMQRESIMIGNAAAYSSVVPIKEPDADDIAADSEMERLQNIGTSIIGTESISQSTIDQLMKQYVDQEKQSLLEGPSEVPDNNMHTPLTPLDEDDDE